MNYKRDSLLFLFPALLCIAPFSHAINAVQNYRVPIFSQNITAPIYSIPFQRALTPPDTWSGWWLTLMPFFQTNSLKIHAPALDDFKIRNIEGGLMIGLGYYGKYWYIREAFDFVESNITTEYISDNFKIDNESNFRLLDDLIALGLKTNNERDWQLSGEGFYGISNARIRQFKKVDNEHMPLANAPCMGTGAQINFNYVWDEKIDARSECLALSRFTYFIPVKATDIDEWSIFNRHDIGSIHYSPGGFLDFFLSYKHSWGDDLRHQYEVGYNPTIHVMNESVKAVKDYDKAIITPFPEYIPPLYNTLYATYRYTRDGRMPISVSIGGTLSVASHISPFGTFFAMFAIRI